MSQDKIRIPVEGASGVWIRYNALPRQSPFAVQDWPSSQLTDTGGGWFEVDLASLGLADGLYEYELAVARPNTAGLEGIADPYAQELTRYGGTRGVLRMAGGRRVPPPFHWSGEPDLRQLPGNHQLVIYELPMRWVEAPEEGYARQVGLGTFDKALFERLDYWKKLGINAIELTPVQDSPDTLNWGYGSRFFFAPDFDMGDPYELRMFVLKCHQQGIRVLLDVVMNHSRKCPLENLAFDLFYLRNPGDSVRPGFFLGDDDKNERKDRPDWGGKVFRYAHPVNNKYWARDLQYDMAEFWIRDYHVDGFRIDEFKGINNWDFIWEFTGKAHDANGRWFPGRPFLVIAEDSWRRAQTTAPTYKEGRPVVDAIWDFDFQEGLRRLVTNTWYTEWQKPLGGRRDLVIALLKGDGLWIEGEKKWRDHGFSDLAQRVIYPTSHDVEARQEQRLWGFLCDSAAEATRDHSVPGIERSQAAMEMQVAAFALTCTARGIPMFLAGEEFAEAHDLPHWDWRQKMSDVVDWYRCELPGHKEVLRRVRELVTLRCTAGCLHWNGLEFFGFHDGGFHPTFNDNDGERVFAFCRPGNQALGRPQQVIVVANCRAMKYDTFVLNAWPWGALPLKEIGGKGQPLPQVAGNTASLALDVFQVRVFQT